MIETLDVIERRRVKATLNFAVDEEMYCVVTKEFDVPSKHHDGQDSRIYAGTKVLITAIKDGIVTFKALDEDLYFSNEYDLKLGFNKVCDFFRKCEGLGETYTSYLNKYNADYKDKKHNLFLSMFVGSCCVLSALMIYLVGLDIFDATKLASLAFGTIPCILSIISLYSTALFGLLTVFDSDKVDKRHDKFLKDLTDDYVKLIDSL